jgi:hypothetical protein
MRRHSILGFSVFFLSSCPKINSVKKIYYIFACFMISALIGNAQCTLDTSNTYFGFTPADTTLPVIIQGSQYDTSIQFYSAPVISDSTDTIHILSTILDTVITGLPRGITAIQNPTSTTVSAGGRFCLQLSGVTNSNPGKYNLGFSGTVHIVSLVLGDTLISVQALDTLIMSHGLPAPYVYSVWVGMPYVAPCNGLDSNNLTHPGVYPVATALPCIVQSVPYFQTVQGMVQSDSTVTINLPVIGNTNAVFTVDSVRIDSIDGVPNGITYGISPRVVLGGGKGCISFYGTTTDPVGNYPLKAIGHAWLTGSVYGQSIPYEKSGDLTSVAPFNGYFLRVVSTADSCHLYIDSTTAIKDYSSSLNARINVFPNPNNGIFTLQVNAASPVSGKVIVYDATGRQIYEQPIDVLGPYITSIDISRFSAGLYTLQISTPQGSAVKKISIQ